MIEFLSMTIEEEKSVIGNVVVEYDQVKKRLAALEAEGQAIGQSLAQIVGALKTPLTSIHFPDVRKYTVAPEKIFSLLDEIKEKLERKMQLAKTLKDYGLDID